MNPSAHPRLGLDFDGTVVVYDEVFHRHARERFAMPANLPVNKTFVRDWLRGQPDGERKWIELQGWVYGLKMAEAKLAPGLADFLRAIRAARIPVCIISHKTELSAAEPRVNLRAAALAWLEANGFFTADGFGLRREDVFFESTRAAKLQRIAAQGCTLFVDDLAEVLTEPEFPPGVERWHYLPGQAESRQGEIQDFADWAKLLTRLAPDEPIFAAVAAALGQRPDTVTRLAGGANNVVARVDVGGKQLLAKLYVTHARDPRDRLGTEFGVLEFLWRNGVRCVPEPLRMSREHNLGLYEFVAGARVSAGRVTWPDVQQLADLLAAMWRLRTQPGAEKLPPASEAAFTINGYWANVERRLNRVRAALADRPEVAAVRKFVERELVPVVAEVRKFVSAKAPELGVGLDSELPPAQRTLSPADHGFHNVLQRVGGKLTFLDFEYAGWDDPAQVLANALLLPEVPLPAEHRVAFLRAMLARLDGADGVAARLRLTYPMLALKWSLIMLNEFLPVGGERRAFAGANEETRRVGQLAKARRQLEVVREALGPDCLLAEFR
ncbi:MAG: phosphotransferase [Limisphaerales bacterium]